MPGSYRSDPASDGFKTTNLEIFHGYGNRVGKRHPDPYQRNGFLEKNLMDNTAKAIKIDETKTPLTAVFITI